MILLDYETDNGKRGLGDVIISTPVIQALAEKYGTRIDVVLRKEAKLLLRGNPYVRNIYDSANGLKPDLHLVMGWKLECHDNPRNNQSRVDAMSELFGVHPVNKNPVLYYYGAEKIPNSIGISIESTNIVRSWRTDYMLELIRKPGLSWYVFAVEALDLPEAHSVFGKLELTNLIDKVSQMEMFVTVDSMFSHLTTALEIPTIVMYTEVPAEWRCSYYPNTIGLQAKIACSPCWERQHPAFKKEIEECYQRQNDNQSIKCIDYFTPAIISKAIDDYLL